MIIRMISGFMVLMLMMAGCNSTQQPHSSAVGEQSHQAEQAVPASKAGLTKEVSIVNQKGESIGKATLREEKGGVRIRIEATGLTPGLHGFHIHEKTFQNNDFQTAGAHFNPTNKEHGLKNPKGPHVGDMHNLPVDQNGKALHTDFINQATLKKGHPFSLLGKSIIIHAKPDDQISNPAGNSGDRVAGGNIME